MTLRSNSKKILTGASALALALAGTVLISTPAAAAPLTANDEASLAAAITTANLDAAPDVITLGADITLTTDLPEITESLEIIGAGHTIAGAGNHVFGDWAATPTIDLTFTGITITNSGSGIGIGTGKSNVTIVDSSFTGAPVSVMGVGITVVVSGSSFDNTSGGSGFYLDVSDTASISINNSSATGNNDDGFDLRVQDNSTASLVGVTATNNGFDGFYVDVKDNSTLTISNSTSSDNRVDGYAVSADSQSTAEISNSTASDNRREGVYAAPEDRSTFTITSVTSTNNGDNGFYVVNHDASTTAITSSSASANGLAGFELNAFDDSVITGSQLTATGNTTHGLNAWSISGSTVSISDSSFDATTAGYGAEIFPATGSAVSLTRVTAADNSESGIWIHNPNNQSSPTDDRNTVTITDSTISDNDSSGMWIAVDHTDISVQGSTISGNSAVRGGGMLAALYGASDMLITNSTISGNTAESVGGLRINGDVDTATTLVTIAHSTITKNDSSVSGAGGVSFNNGQLAIHHTVIAENTSAGIDAVAGQWDLRPQTEATVTVNHSLVGIATHDAVAAMTAGTGNISTTEPMLGALADNGGLTLTHLPLDGSPLIDAGNPAITGAPATDQRGLTRIVDTIDFGAVETQPASAGADDTLPATGFEVSLPLIGAATSLLLLGGALILARRRLTTT